MIQTILKFIKLISPFGMLEKLMKFNTHTHTHTLHLIANKSVSIVNVLLVAPHHAY